MISENNQLYSVNQFKPFAGRQLPRADNSLEQTTPTVRVKAEIAKNVSAYCGIHSESYYMFP